MLRQHESLRHPFYDFEDVLLIWEDDAFEVDGVVYQPLARNPHGSRILTLKSDFHYDLYNNTNNTIAWDNPMIWWPSGDEYWDNRRSP